MRSIVGLVLALSTLGACDPDPQRSAGTVVGAVDTRSEEKAEGGVHRRVTTPHGPLHVWTPQHYSESGDIVVYVHADVDRAWTDGRLAAQFAASGLDAMFIASDPSWGSLAEVLGTAQARTQLALPMGKVIVVGRAPLVAPWMAESQLDRLVVTDVAGEVAGYRAWLDARRDRQLIFVGGESATQLHGLLPAATVLAQVPALGQARATRVVYVKSAGSAALPVLLQMAGDDAATPVAKR